MSGCHLLDVTFALRALHLWPRASRSCLQLWHGSERLGACRPHALPAGKLERLVIGNRGRAWPPMHKECVPLVGLCSSLQTLALWQLPTEPDAMSDAALATALAQLPHLKVRNVPEVLQRTAQ